MEIITASSLGELNSRLIYENVVQIGVSEPLNQSYFTRHLEKNLQFFKLNVDSPREYFALVKDTTVVNNIYYNAIANEILGKWYIEATVLDEDLDSTTIKALRQIMEANEALVNPVSIAPNVGKRLVFEVATTLDAKINREDGMYRYEVTKADDSVYRFYFYFEGGKVVGVYQILPTLISDYNAFFNYVDKKWYLDIPVVDKELNAINVKSIKMIKKAGVDLPIPEDVTVTDETTFLFDIAETNGDLAYRGNGEYRYEVITKDDIKYVFHFTYDSTKVVGVEEMIEATIDYNGNYNATDEIWYLDVTASNQDLDTTKVKDIKLIVEAGELLDTPESITVGTNKKYLFDIALADGELDYRANGLYLFECTRTNDNKFIFYFVYEKGNVVDVT